jgi:hypothetical protein
MFSALMLMFAPIFHAAPMGPFVMMILSLAVVGFILWLIVTYIPMPAPIKQVIIVLVVILVILWLCRSFGLF